MTKAIVFSHANGFPAGTYRLLFNAWRDAGFEVHAVEQYGHDPRYPVTSNWPHLRDQLIHFIEREVTAPAYLVGHSLGGYLSLLTAARRPELAAGVVLLDSPVLAGWKARAVQLFKGTAIGERLSPARVARRRRQQWPSAEAALAHFASKPAFARWAPGVLADYVASGVRPDRSSNGIGEPAVHRLGFDRDVEAAIYNALPHHLMRVLTTHPLRCPLAFIGGTESEEVRQVGLRATKRLTQGRMSMLPGSHLFPFERPAEAAAEVLRCIAEFKQHSL